MSASGWIGVDFDGTLAEYEGWKGDFTFGRPIPKMVERVRKWCGEGITVKIFTARAYGNEPEIIKAIQDWCEEHIGWRLEVTNVKDYSMIELWDDRAIQVVHNTGERVGNVET